ncbi:alpha/beta hydrolase [Solimonas sp. K1W22B-7]|uniref:alpha/beta hydrolase n=1 Tax=Solimonas sp. K1W22B-7 TaxID=2303331 RepID=UPI000E32F146|nr:alpha/beta hydrolase [Solimonas sp. K1W22B-7]AXQ27611.1 alpha/beta hydrolase [Solimonas sp. K1W22B-7]
MTLRPRLAPSLIALALLAAGCSRAPETPEASAPAVTPMTPINTVSAEAQALFANPPSLPNVDGIPMALKRKALSLYQDRFGETLNKKYGSVVDVSESEIAGVPVLVVQPRGKRHPTQLLLNLHGGGFVLDSGSLTETIPMAALTGRTVIAVLYRLAPEHPYPASADDALAVYRKLLETHPPRDIIVFGTSAGATLTAQMAVRLKAQGIPMPAALGIFSVISDFSRRGESMLHLNPLIGAPPKKVLDEELGKFVGDKKDLNDPLLSPLFADLKGLPPTLLISGTRDLLLSQTALLHRALLRVGVDADLVVFEGMPHAHWAYLDLPESGEAFGMMARFFEKQFAQAGAVTPLDP